MSEEHQDELRRVALAEAAEMLKGFAGSSEKPWAYDKLPPTSESATKLMDTKTDMHKFKLDPAKVADIFSAKGESDSSETKTQKAALEVGQWWQTRSGRAVHIVTSYDEHTSGGYTHQGDVCDAVGARAFDHWSYGAPQDPTNEWRVINTDEHNDDLVKLLKNADGSDASDQIKPKPKPKKENKPTEAGGEPKGALEERVVELIKAHAPASVIDPAQIKDMIDEAVASNVSTLKIEIPQLKVDHTEDHAHKMFPILLELIANSERVFLSGPPGSGKTTATEKVAEILKRPLFIQGPVADEFKLTGFIDAHGNFQDTEVYRWATTPGAILMLDEVDGSFPQPLLFLNMALANGYIVFPGKGKVHIDKANTVVANGNTWGGGADFDFVGRSKLDAAFVNRFPAKLVWDYDEKFETALAIGSNGGTKEHVKVMHTVRKNARDNGIKVHVTPRDTFYYCRCRARGWSHEQALDTGLLATCKSDQREKLLRNVTAG